MLFSDNLTVVLDFLALHNKHNISALSVNRKLICTRKARQRLAFLLVSKACTNAFDIFRQFRYIVYKYRMTILSTFRILTSMIK
jgi:hypothetical protein